MVSRVKRSAKQEPPSRRKPVILRDAESGEQRSYQLLKKELGPGATAFSRKDPKDVEVVEVLVAKPGISEQVVAYRT